MDKYQNIDLNKIYDYKELPDRIGAGVTIAVIRYLKVQQRTSNSFVSAENVG